MINGPYNDWGQVGGYFDGDGSSDFKIGKRVVFVRLHFTDNYRPQLENVEQFLGSQGVRTEAVSDTLAGASRLGIGQFRSVREMAVKMLPYTFKKRRELQAILDYFDNGITGNQLIEAMNKSVKDGNRVGKIRKADIPFTREEGRRLDKTEKMMRAREMIAKNQKLSNQTLERIRAGIISGEYTNGELAKKYGVDPSTISRAVFGRTDWG
jgi:hypothetical protein